MGKFFSSVINDKDKKLNWLNCNYCYAGTLTVIAFLILSFCCFQDKFNALVASDYHWNILLCAFRWSGGGYHLLGNIMGLLVSAIFLERHFGSVKFLGLILVSIPIDTLATFGFTLSPNWAGFSGIEYILYANMLLVMLFHFKHYFVGKRKWIFPVVILLLMVIMMSWTWTGDGVGGVGIKLFDCLTNEGHGAPFIAGTCMGLFANIYSLKKKE